MTQSGDVSECLAAQQEQWLAALGMRGLRFRSLICVKRDGRKFLAVVSQVPLRRMPEFVAWLSREEDLIAYAYATTMMSRHASDQSKVMEHVMIFVSTDVAEIEIRLEITEHNDGRISYRRGSYLPAAVGQYDPMYYRWHRQNIVLSPEEGSSFAKIWSEIASTVCWGSANLDDPFDCVNAARRFTRVDGNVVQTDCASYDVLGLINITLPSGAWCWKKEDINEPRTKGAIFRAYESVDGPGLDMAYLLIVDVNNDEDEPDVRKLTVDQAKEFDAFLHAQVKGQFERDGRRLLHWLSSSLNNGRTMSSLVTIYIGEEKGNKRKYIDCRLRVGENNMVIAGCFDLSRTAMFEVALIEAMKDAKLLHGRHG